MEIKRDVYLDKLIRKKKNGLIKVVTGVRRCGKSYLLFHLFHDHLLDSGVAEDHIIEIALDDRSNKELRDPDVILKLIKESIKDKEDYYIILDEVQYLDEFEDVLNSLLHIRNADVYVTGSNSKFLSSDVITQFRGRGDEIRVYPLSFSEYVSVYQGSQDEAWDDYTIKYTYSTNKNVGAGCVSAVVKFKGGYTGTIKKRNFFAIVPKNTKLKSAKAGKKSITLKWKKRKDISGYQISVTDENYKRTKCYKIKSKNKTTYKIKGLKRHKKYYISLQTYKKVKPSKKYKGVNLWKKMESYGVYKTVKTK